MKGYQKISKPEVERLLNEFCQAISVLKNSQEIMNFITDLLTKKEVVMLAKRIKIAKLLLEGENYSKIREILKVGNSTIARVSQWLAESGEGFRLIHERTQEEKLKPPTSWDYFMSDWRKLRRRYPSMFWPELLIEEIIKTMNKRQKEKIRRAIEKLDHKSSLYKQINKLFKIIK